MTDNVVKFTPEIVGEGFKFDPDELLEAAKGQGFETLVIMGHKPDGELWISGMPNLGECVILIELAKHHLLFSDD